MLVDEYTLRFLDLSCVAKYLTPDKERKDKNSERGLNLRILSDLIPLKIRNLNDLVTRATVRLEDVLKVMECSE